MKTFDPKNEYITNKYKIPFPTAKRSSLPSTDPKSTFIPLTFIETEYNNSEVFKKKNWQMKNNQLAASFKDIKLKLMKFLKHKKNSKTEFFSESEKEEQTPKEQKKFEFNKTSSILNKKNSKNINYNSELGNDYMLNNNSDKKFLKTVKHTLNAKKRQNTETLQALQSKVESTAASSNFTSNNLFWLKRNNSENNTDFKEELYKFFIRKNHIDEKKHKSENKINECMNSLKSFENKNETSNKSDKKIVETIPSVHDKILKEKHGFIKQGNIFKEILQRTNDLLIYYKKKDEYNSKKIKFLEEKIKELEKP